LITPTFDFSLTGLFLGRLGQVCPMSVEEEPFELADARFLQAG